MLKKMGFLDASGHPTETYGQLKNKKVLKTAIADAVRKVYEPLFRANEKANELSPDELKGLIAQITGADQAIVKQIAYTFYALAKLGDFAAAKPSNSDNPDDKPTPTIPTVPLPQGGLRTDFNFNIQVHLPANGTEETYLNIFNALRRSFS